MRRFAVVSKVTGYATLVSVLATVMLRTLGSESWQTALAVTFALVGVRVAMMAWSVARRELPWTRLLLPSIILIESVGLWGRGMAALWHVRLGTAIALELAFVTIAIRELRRSATSAEPVDVRLARAFSALLPPRAARLVAFELVIVGYALAFLVGGWRRPVPAGFTYHRDSGLRLFLHFLPLLAVGDLLLLELVLLPRAALWLRVVVHVLAVYGLVWLVGFYASLRARPHVLVDGRLVLHRGLVRRLSVPVDDIESVAELPSFADDWKKRAYCKGAIRIDVPGAKVLELRLRKEARAIGVLGEGAPSTRVLVAVDDPSAFTAAI